MAAVNIMLARINSKVLGWRKVTLTVLIMASMFAITLVALISLVMISVRRRSLISKPGASLPKSIVASGEAQIKEYQEELEWKFIRYGAEAKNDDIAQTLSRLGSCYMVFLGNYEEAFNKFKQAHEMLWHIYGRDESNEELAGALNNLGESQINNGNYMEARVNLEQALDMKRQDFGASAENASLAHTLGNLGEAHRNLGDYDEARRKIDEALCMFHRMYTAVSHSNHARALRNLGRLHHDLGQYTEASAKYEEAIEKYRRIYGREPGTADHVRALKDLAMLQADQLRKQQMVLLFVLICLVVFCVAVVTIFGQWGWFDPMYRDLPELGDAAEFTNTCLREEGVSQRFAG